MRILTNGFDFEAVENKDYRSACLWLRAMWATLRVRLPEFHFGRHELKPVRTNAEGVGRYLGKYIVKHYDNRLPEDGGGADCAVFWVCEDGSADVRQRAEGVQVGDCGCGEISAWGYGFGAVPGFDKGGSQDVCHRAFGGEGGAALGVYSEGDNLADGGSGMDGAWAVVVQGIAVVGRLWIMGDPPAGLLEDELMPG